MEGQIREHFFGSEQSETFAGDGGRGEREEREFPQYPMTSKARFGSTEVYFCKSYSYAVAMLTGSCQSPPCPERPVGPPCPSNLVRRPTRSWSV